MKTLESVKLLREFEGRAELAAEEAAEGDILAKAVELGFSDEVCGDGSGGNGPETLYLLKRGAI